MKSPLTFLAQRRMAAFARDLMERHYQEVEGVYRQMRGWKHDYHHHIQMIQALAQGLSPELDAYLLQLNDDLSRVDTLIKTGNIMMDAMVNSKLSLAQERGIAIDAHAYVPKDLSISSVDLCVILGNLLDNAMEACEKLPAGEKPFLRLYMDVLKGQLYCSVANAAHGRPRPLGKGFATAKQGMHGFGLLRIDRVVARYKGYVNRQHEEGVFVTEILLPL